MYFCVLDGGALKIGQVPVATINHLSQDQLQDHQLRSCHGSRHTLDHSTLSKILCAAYLIHFLETALVVGEVKVRSALRLMCLLICGSSTQQDL